MGKYADLAERINFMHNHPGAMLTPFQVEQTVEYIRSLPKKERAELVGLFNDVYCVIPSPRKMGRSVVQSVLHPWWTR